MGDEPPSDPPAEEPEAAPEAAAEAAAEAPAEEAAAPEAAEEAAAEGAAAEDAAAPAAEAAVEEPAAEAVGEADAEPAAEAAAEEAPVDAGEAPAAVEAEGAAEGTGDAAVEGEGAGAEPSDAPREGGEEATEGAAEGTKTEGGVQGEADAAAETEPEPEPEPEPELELEDPYALRPMTGASEGGALEIEGFDDDFEEDNFLGEEMQEGAYDEEEDMDDADAAEQDLGPDLELLLAEAKEVRAKLTASSVALQKKLYTIFSNRKTTELRDAQGKLQAEGQEARYVAALNAWFQAQEEEERITAHYETASLDTRARLEERVTRADDIRAAFRTFQLEVARSSENSRTGKPIPERVIQERMALAQRKEEEVERVRLKNIMARNRMKKLEAHLKAKEELAEGLHLIDFEQLKIENQSLNEKIEERNEELLKLRKKTTTTVQVLTHLKEKLQFVQKQAEGLHSELSSLDSELAGKRDLLNREKLERDALRAENARIKAASGIITNTSLLDDLQAHKEKRDVMKERAAAAQRRYTEMQEQIARLKAEAEFQASQELMGMQGMM